MQYGPNFFNQRRSNHLYGLLPRVSCRKKSLKRLPRFGRIVVTNLVLNYLQDRCFQVRIVRCPFINMADQLLWLAHVSSYAYLSLSLISFLLATLYHV
jgi:hypothetical protein